jgi:uncharacterized repeat protein (TIGR01451 family)
LQYKINVSNLQPDMATHNVILEDIIPKQTDFITATLPHSITNGTISWAIGDLAAGATTQVTLTIKIPLTIALGTVVSNQYSAYSDEANLVIGEPVSTTIHKLAVEKSVPQVVVRGYPLTYTLTVTNLQPDAVTHQVLLTDTIPENTDFITATGNYSVTGNLVTWEMGDLGMGASDSVEFVVQAAVTATKMITNAAYGVVSMEADIPAKGEAAYTFVQIPGMALSSGQSGLIFDPCNPSIILIYAHQITNKGNYTDTFDLSVDSSLGWASLAYDHFTLASGESVIFDVEISPPCPTPPGTVDAAAIMISSQADPSISGIITDTTLVGYRRLLPAIFLDR